MSTAQKHSTAGMTRQQIQQQSHQRRISMLSYIESHGRVDMNELEAELGFSRTAMFQWLMKMNESGHVLIEQEENSESRGLCIVNFYLRGPSQEPLGVYVHGCAAAKKGAPEMQEKRRVVKATDCGMKSDPLALPRDFFGSARQVGA
jgi:hypothetical protein